MAGCGMPIPMNGSRPPSNTGTSPHLKHVLGEGRTPRKWAIWGGGRDILRSIGNIVREPKLFITQSVLVVLQGPPCAQQTDHTSWSQRWVKLRRFIVLFKQN